MSPSHPVLARAPLYCRCISPLTPGFQTTRCPYLLEFSIRAFYSRGEAVSDAVQARLNGDLTGSFAQYFSNIDFSKFRPGVDPAQLLRMLTWMTEGYMNEKQRAGVPLRLEDILADYSGWEEMFRKIAYKEEYL